MTFYRLLWQTPPNRKWFIFGRCTDFINCDFYFMCTLQWRHKGRDGVSNHPRLDCLLNHLFRRRSKKTSKLRVTGLCEGNSPVNSPHKGPVTRKMFPFEDVIMILVQFFTLKPQQMADNVQTTFSITFLEKKKPHFCLLIQISMNLNEVCPSGSVTTSLIGWTQASNQPCTRSPDIGQPCGTGEFQCGCPQARADICTE